jgi:tight adherence protein B
MQKENKDGINYKTHELFVLPYTKSALPFFIHVIFGIAGYAAGFCVIWLFYRRTAFAVFGALAFVPALILMNIGAAKKKRLNNLLRQFQSFLDSLVVSLQAGRTDLGAMESAVGDLELMYSPKADIVKEIRLVVKKFGNRQSIGEAFTDFAERSGLEDVKIFAEIYSAVEGKGAKTREIVLRTQKILSDKIEIQEEIKTIISSAVMELNIISIIPIVIAAIMGFMGGEMMEGLFTPTGHVIATVAVIIFVAAYILGRKLANIKF